MAKKKLQGQVAIITGGGRVASVRRRRRGWPRPGAKLVLAARSEEEVESAWRRALRRQGAQALAVPGDVSDPEVVEEIVETALEQFDRVDILVNNAAVIWPLEETVYADPDEWAYNINTNLIAPFLLARNVLPVMLEQRYGRILNISSGAAATPVFGGSAYCAAKAGLDMFARVLALESGRRRRLDQHAQPRPGRHGNARGHPQRRHDRHAPGHTAGFTTSTHAANSPPRPASPT
jgi:NAD(P)-dependent dehydrogenase (short-subunit alcohol dehydrogenase family)